MKLSKKIKYRSWKVQDRLVLRYATFLSVILGVAIWLPKIKEITIQVTVSNLAVTCTLLTFVWMGATAMSMVEDYTIETTTLAGVATFCWSAPSILIQNFIENWGWGIDSNGIVPTITLVLFAMIVVGLLTRALRNNK